MKSTRGVGVLVTLVATLAAVCGHGDARAEETHVLCTTFPIHQITRNVTDGHGRAKVELLLPASLGCPHHYSLTPQDMQKLARADVLVVNGLGMEEFLGAPVKKAKAKLVVIDSSKGIEGLLHYAGGHDAHGHGEEHDAESGHHHQEAGVNPHLFVSPRQAAQLALNIAAGLSKADPEGATVYLRNAKAYAERLNALADEQATRVKELKNNRIVQPHGAFDYLARDIGLEVVAVTQPHGQEPSAAEMLELVRSMREKQAGAVFTEPQYSPKVGQTLAKETGIPTAVLDPVASGPEDAPLDYYETAMRKNLETLRATLGVKP